MTVLIFFFRLRLREGALQGREHKYRVVAEAAGSMRSFGNAPFDEI